MMNAARFNVGMQGVAISERAYQRAAAYAKDRLQSRDLAGSEGPVAIIHDPDVKRMLLTMRALHTSYAFFSICRCCCAGCEPSFRGVNQPDWKSKHFLSF
jgi:hypothetical protein